MLDIQNTSGDNKVSTSRVAGSSGRLAVFKSEGPGPKHIRIMRMERVQAQIPELGGIHTMSYIT